MALHLGKQELKSSASWVFPTRVCGQITSLEPAPGRPHPAGSAGCSLARHALCLLFSPACGSWPEPPGSPVGCVGSLEPGKLASCPGGCEGRGGRQIPTDSGQRALASAPHLTWTPTPFPGRTPRRRRIRHECCHGALSCLNAAFHPVHRPQKLLMTDQPSC